MNSELIMKSDVLDILFEKRNKLYGAYTLRKFYNNRLMKSIAGMLSMVVVFISFSFIEHSGNNTGAVANFLDSTRMGFILPDEVRPEIKPPLKAPSKTLFSTRKLVSTFIMVDNSDSTDKLKDLDKLAIGSTDFTAPSDAGPLVGDVTPHDGFGTANTVVKSETPVVDINTPVENPEVEPSFPGGMDALRRFLQRNLTNPKEMEEGEAVSVKVKFVVGYDGKLQRFETIEDGGSEFNNEVLRVLKKMPEWMPGKSKGRNVAVYYTIPVKFVADK